MIFLFEFSTNLSQDVKCCGEIGSAMKGFASSISLMEFNFAVVNVLFSVHML